MARLQCYFLHGNMHLHFMCRSRADEIRRVFIMEKFKRCLQIEIAHKYIQFQFHMNNQCVEHIQTHLINMVD